MPELKPHAGDIEQHLRHITRRWEELNQPCLLEAVFLSADDRAVVKNVSHFHPNASGIEFAADHIANMNAANLNAYVTVNPLDANNCPQAGKRASAEHIAGSFFHWADADTEQAAQNIKNFAGPRCTMHVITGSQPCTRPHVYWELEDPTRNLTAWSATQRAIAEALGTDPAVVDPPRIMRIAGTINWPKPQKIAKGYIPEVTTLRIYDANDRPPVSSERMARAFAGAEKKESESTFDFDPGHQSINVEEYLDLIRRAGTDGQKHAAVRDLTAKMARAGVPRNMTQAIVRTVCPVWDENVENLIETAYRNFYKADAENIEVPLVAPFKSWQPINPLMIPPRDFIYGRHYIRKFASVTVAPGGLGKSTLVLAECIAIATGKPILGIVPKQRARVVYFNAEDPTDEIDRRIVAMCQHHDIPQEELVDWLYRASGRDNELILSAGENGDIVERTFELVESWSQEIKPAVIAFDPLANMTESPETNDVFRRLGKRISRMADMLNCSVELVHHTRKLNGREAEIEDSRGGGALIGAVRAGRVLNPMTSDESVRARLDTHIDHFRIEAAGKNNLARPSPHAEWLRRVDVELANGDHVAAVEPWQWPDAFDGVSAADARRVQVAVAEMEADPPRENVQAKEWVGHVVARVLSLDTDDKADKERIKQMVRTWVKAKVLTVEDGRDSRTGRDTKFVFAGPNNPASTGECDK